MNGPSATWGTGDNLFNSHPIGTYSVFYEAAGFFHGKKKEQQRPNKMRQRENHGDSGIDSASHISEGIRVGSVERAGPLSELSSPPRQGDSAPAQRHGTGCFTVTM